MWQLVLREINVILNATAPRCRSFSKSQHDRSSFATASRPRSQHLPFMLCRADPLDAGEIPAGEKQASCFDMRQSCLPRAGPMQDVVLRTEYCLLEVRRARICHYTHTSSASAAGVLSRHSMAAASRVGARLSDRGPTPERPTGQPSGSREKPVSKVLAGLGRETKWDGPSQVMP